MSRYRYCDETCTVDCGACKGRRFGPYRNTIEPLVDDFEMAVEAAADHSLPQDVMESHLRDVITTRARLLAAFDEVAGGAK